MVRPKLEELLSLKGKRALVTGAASGIGRAIASRLAEAGAMLELVDVNVPCLNTMQHDLERFPIKARTWVVDLAKKTEIDQLWDALKGDEPDILINCAGIFPFKNFLETDEPFYHNVLEINLNSVYWMCQRMIAARAKRGGVIVNIASIEAVVAFKNDLVHYSISKAGVVALTHSLAREYGRHGFRINAVMPGGILTQGTKNAAKKVLQLQFGLIKTGLDFMNRLPLGRLGQPDEVARVVLMLSTELSSYMQGAVIPVDGGFLVD